MIGIININKPSGMSSSQVVVRVKKLTHQDKVGHLGTLDPLASGVLPICIGKATRLFDYFLNKTKRYTATFEFGKLTTTLDSEGEVLEQSTKYPSKQAVLDALAGLKGELEQYPPKYSAKSIGGVRAYELARQGVDFELKPKRITVYRFDLLEQLDDKTFVFDIECSAGTYIRSLCRDLAESLGCVATMTNLIRTQCGKFNLTESVELENLTLQDVENNLVDLKTALSDMKIFDMSKQLFDRLLKGLKTKIRYKDGEFLAICENVVVGIVEIKQTEIKIKTYLKE